MTEIATRNQPGTLESRNRLPVALDKPIVDLDEAWRLSAILAQTTMVPQALQNRPGNVLIMIMTGQELGLTWNQALRQVYVTKGGQPGLKGEFLLMRLHEKGHDYDYSEPITDRCEFRLHRGHEGPVNGYEPKPCGKGRDYFGRFTLADAEAAGLITMREGKPTARSQSGSPLPWEQYGSDMLFWRAVARAVRRGAPEVTMGFGLAGTASDDDTTPDGPVVTGTVLPESPPPTPPASTLVDELADLDAQHGGETVEAEVVELHPEPEPDPTMPPSNADTADTPREATTAASSSVPNAEAPSPAPTSDEVSWAQEAGEDEDGPASTSLLTSLGRQFKAAGYNDREQRAFTCSVIVRHWITKPGELTTGDANAVIAQLRAWHDQLTQAGDESPGDSPELITVQTEALRAAWEADEPDQFGGDEA